jgi:hypothetical protein
VRAVVAESILTKHQLLILNRSRRRAPHLRMLDRLIAGFCSLWIMPNRLRRVAIAFKPSTLLKFHRALVERKYRLLFSRRQRTKPGLKGPDADLIHAGCGFWRCVTPRCQQKVVRPGSRSLVMRRTVCGVSTYFDANRSPCERIGYWS